MHDLTITITTYNRPFVLEKSLKSLQKATNLPVVIIDDASTDNNTKKTLLKYGMQKNNWQVKFNKSNLGAAANNSTRGQYVNTKWMYITDSDVIYSRQFTQRLKALKEYCTQCNGIGTLFNTYTANRHQEINNHEFSNDKYVVKRSIGGVSMLIETSLFNEVMPVYKDYLRPGYTGWDYGLVFYAQEHNIPLISTRKSYVDHIGLYGVHSNGACDKAKEFVT